MRDIRDNRRYSILVVDGTNTVVEEGTVFAYTATEARRKAISKFYVKTRPGFKVMVLGYTSYGC